MQVLTGLEHRESDYFEIMFLFVLRGGVVGGGLYPVAFISATIYRRAGIINDGRKNLQSFGKI